MKTSYLTILSVLLLSFSAFSQGTKAVNPLAEYSNEWADPKYNACNTARGASYMTEEERTLIWVLNMARVNPRLFCRTVVAPYSKSNGIDMESETYYLSLMKQMRNMEALNILQPDKVCFVSAECHAVSSGKRGYTGHNRQTAECRKVQKFNGECCSYGVEDAIGVVVTLLVDEDVPSLGHRNILLGGYTKTGVAMRPHKGYRTNTVIDFLR